MLEDEEHSFCEKFCEKKFSRTFRRCRQTQVLISSEGFGYHQGARQTFCVASSMGRPTQVSHEGWHALSAPQNTLPPFVRHDSLLGTTQMRNSGSLTLFQPQLVQCGMQDCRNEQ